MSRTAQEYIDLFNANERNGPIFRGEPNAVKAAGGHALVSADFRQVMVDDGAVGPVITKVIKVLGENVKRAQNGATHAQNGVADNVIPLRKATKSNPASPRTGKPKGDSPAEAFAKSRAREKGKLTARAEAKAKQDSDKDNPQAIKLLALAQDLYRFGRTKAGEPFAVLKDGPNLALSLKGNDSLRAQLAKRYHDSYAAMPSQTALASVLLHLLALCDDSDPEQVHLRIARDGSNTVLDLGDASGACVVITAKGWTVEERSPILFRRTAATLALPRPVVKNGGLEPYRALFNISGESWPLVLAYLVSVFWPDVAHPIMLLSGEQGAAKTTTAKDLVSLIDPCEAPVRAGPRNLDDWQVAASASYVVALDNLSTVSEWLSDALCRASTGDGLVKRALYTDKDVVLLSVRRMVIITAIELGSLRGDLGDRLLVVELENITEKKRKKDADVAAAFTKAHPAALGALLDLVVKVKAMIAKGLNLKELPRMADFGEILAALDKINGTTSLATYRGQAVDIAREVSDADSVTRAINAFLGGQPNGWSGSATHLYDRLTTIPNQSNGYMKPPTDWPKNPAVLAGRLKRIAPALRKLGLDITFERKGDEGKRIIKLARATTPVSSLAAQHSDEDPWDGEEDA